MKCIVVRYLCTKGKFMPVVEPPLTAGLSPTSVSQGCSEYPFTKVASKSAQWPRKMSRMVSQGFSLNGCLIRQFFKLVTLIFIVLNSIR